VEFVKVWKVNLKIKIKRVWKGKFALSRKLRKVWVSILVLDTISSTIQTIGPNSQKMLSDRYF
jgi:hypothetical protein